MGGDNGGGKNEGFSGTIKRDTWKKTRGNVIRAGRWNWLGCRGEEVEGKCREMYIEQQ